MKFPVELLKKLASENQAPGYCVVHREETNNRDGAISYRSVFAAVGECGLMPQLWETEYYIGMGCGAYQFAKNAKDAEIECPEVVREVRISYVRKSSIPPPHFCHG